MTEERDMEMKRNKEMLGGTFNIVEYCHIICVCAIVYILSLSSYDEIFVYVIQSKN